MKKAVIGILAHVDAGKTTLSEGLLYLSGSIRKFGRVDHQDAFLDFTAQFLEAFWITSRWNVSGVLPYSQNRPS